MFRMEIVVPHCFISILLVLSSWYYLLLIKVKMLIVISISLILSDFAHYLQMVLLLSISVFKYFSIFLQVGVKEFELRFRLHLGNRFATCPICSRLCFYECP